MPIKKPPTSLFKNANELCTIETTNYSKTYWEDVDNQRLFMERLSKKLNITDQSGWYKTTCSLLRKHGASPLLQLYNNSLSQLLAVIYPQYLHDNSLQDSSLLKYKWNHHSFARLPQNYWNHKVNQRAFMDDLAKQLNIQNHDLWYKISWTTLGELGGSTLLLRYNNSPSKLLMSIYPEYRKKR